MPALNAAAYTDLARLASLKKPSGGQESLKQVAQEFEALLLGQMLKAMRAASNVLSEGSYLQSNETKLYQEMLDQQLAVTLSRQKGLGLSEVLVRQLSPAATGSAPMAEAESLRRDKNQSTPALEQAHGQWQMAAKGATTFSSPAEFIQRLKPLAESTAAKIGLQPLWLLAQAALESGWGRNIARFASGQSSHNLFGIKAHGWDGASVKAATTEYQNGKVIQKTARFRAYPSFAHSFADYLSFLQNNPRYQEALQRADNPEQFINALQQAGYASDPDYAQKIKKIVDRL